MSILSICKFNLRNPMLTETRLQSIARLIDPQQP
jgi:hypothetical protein